MFLLEFAQILGFDLDSNPQIHSFFFPCLFDFSDLKRDFDDSTSAIHPRLIHKMNNMCQHIFLSDFFRVCEL